MSSRIKDYIKITAVLVISFFLSGIMVKYIFVSYSPTVRNRLPQYISFKVKKLVAAIKKYIPGQQTAVEPSSVMSLLELKQNLDQLAPGVKAASDTGISYIEYELEDVKWKEYTYTKNNGEKVTIRVPEGGEKPAAEEPQQDNAAQPVSVINSGVQ